ncbi:hypothetical protein SAMN05444273_107233 [Litoreibacter ascidiaceicola]|uniref:Uncharacterized protein n=1 Tax=Litoreibacter ascidiaceicola TaxID=1486859 RepID=A0A1M5CQK3_9RHOB|nr:hypothetical protein SAMN05444273_107233 [Litoreibacter ascidiaceicola]
MRFGSLVPYHFIAPCRAVDVLLVMCSPIVCLFKRDLRRLSIKVRIRQKTCLRPLKTPYDAQTDGLVSRTAASPLVEGQLRAAIYQ